jgi:translation elongation factor EF-Ts
MPASKKATESKTTNKSTAKKTSRKSGKTIEEYIEMITPYLKRDNSLKKSCILAEVPYTTVLDHYQGTRSVRAKIDKIISGCQDMAKQVIASSIAQGDVNTAKWWLEKRDVDYQPTKQVEVITDRANPNALTEEENGKFDDLMNNFFE